MKRIKNRLLLIQTGLSSFFSKIETLFQPSSFSFFSLISPSEKENVKTGNFCQGSLIEIMGPTCSGKTALAFFWIAQTQKQGGLCAYFTSKLDSNPLFAQKLGVQFAHLFWAHPQDEAEAFHLANELLLLQKFSLVVMDSFSPEITLSKESFSKRLSSLCTLARQSKCTLVFCHPLLFCLQKELRFYANTRLFLSPPHSFSSSSLEAGCLFIKAHILKRNSFSLKSKNEVLDDKTSFTIELVYA